MTGVYFSIKNAGTITAAIKTLYKMADRILINPSVEKLMDAGIIQGDGSDSTGNGDVIHLSHDQVRTLVFIYRGGGFDAKL